MPASHRILIVEDSLSLAETYRAYLQRLGGGVHIAGTLAAARAHLGNAEGGLPDVVLLDVKLPDGTGIELLKDLNAQADMPRVIVMTAHGSVSVAVEAMREGAADFLVKPFDADRLVTTVKNALEHSRLSRLVRRYEASFKTEGYGRFVGKSLAMQAVYRIIDGAAPSKASVFVTGESGTGKELCAEALHHRSPRAHAAFVALNCAAMPRDLIESEIFGHKRGAFTGATADREGAAVRAHGGTLFLDEICEMDLNLQSKLLRFVQTGMVQPVGGDEARKVDVRFVCATNRDPWAEVEAGRFREDLLYRLHVIPIELPPLRERGDDAIELATAFMRELAAEENKSFESLSADAEARLRGHRWPGNVRELRNVIQNAVVLNDGPVLEADMLPARLGGAGGEAAGGGARESGPAGAGGDVRPLWRVEKEAIERALDLCDGNVSRAAAKLEVSPSTLYRKLQSWEIEAKRA